MQIGISIQQVAQEAMNENGQKTKYFGKKKKTYVSPDGPDGRRSGKA